MRVFFRNGERDDAAVALFDVKSNQKSTPVNDTAKAMVAQGFFKTPLCFPFHHPEQAQVEQEPKAGKGH